MNFIYGANVLVTENSNNSLAYLETMIKQGKATEALKVFKAGAKPGDIAIMGMMNPLPAIIQRAHQLDALLEKYSK